MTAYHCVKNRTPFELSPILVGGDNITGFRQFEYKMEKGATMHNVLKIHSHPKAAKYQPIDKGYDYAILELVEPITFWKGARPVYLPMASDTDRMSPSSTVIASGWGHTQNIRENQNLLWVVSLNYMPGDRCTFEHLDDPTKICAGVPEGGKDACQGDSGGKTARIMIHFCDKIKLTINFDCGFHINA